MATNEAIRVYQFTKTESVSANGRFTDSIEIDSSMESEESIDTTETTETTEAIIEQQPADSNIETDIVPEAARTCSFGFLVQSSATKFREKGCC